MNIDHINNSGMRATGAIVFYSEITEMIFDAKWILLCVFLLIVCDFWYGRGESRKRYFDAKRKGNDILAAQYKWRTSRALRRTLNKSVDYVIVMALGLCVGKAILPSCGINYMWGGIAALFVVMLCEVFSVFGHLFYLHGVKISTKSIKAFFRSLLVAFVRKKNEDLGNAIDEAIDEMNHENKEENGSKN